MNLPTDTRFDPPCSSGDEDGGAEGVRTPDLLNAIQALYQLSYDPNQSVVNLKSRREMSKRFSFSRKEYLKFAPRL